MRMEPSGLTLTDDVSEPPFKWTNILRVWLKPVEPDPVVRDGNATLITAPCDVAVTAIVVCSVAVEYASKDVSNKYGLQVDFLGLYPEYCPY